MKSWLVVALVLVVGCAANQRAERLATLSPESHQLYDKYTHFMTDLQRDQFIALPGDAERQQFVADLKIDERLAQYPQRIRDAIWAQAVLPGMDKPAVLVSVGIPYQREIDEQARTSTGNDIERWFYKNDAGGVATVVLVNGVVTEVIAAPVRQ